jgi:hypothetical protein
MIRTATRGHSSDRVLLHDPNMEDDDRLLTVEELAEFLDLPVRTLYPIPSDVANR